MTTDAPQRLDPFTIGAAGALNGHTMATGGSGSSTSVGATGIYPASGYGMVALAADPVTADGDSTFGDGTLFMARMYVPASSAIAAAYVAVSVAATGGAAANANGFALYEDDGTQAATVSETAGNLYNSGTGWKGLTFGSPVAAQGSARFVRLAVVVGGWIGVKLWYCDRTGTANTLNGGATATHRRAVFNTGVTSFPASITPATYGTTTAFLPMLGLA